MTKLTTIYKNEDLFEHFKKWGLKWTKFTKIGTNDLFKPKQRKNEGVKNKD